MVRLQEVIDPENQDALILVIDFCAKGEILNYDEEKCRFSAQLDDQEIYSEDQIRKFMRDLVVGLDHLHKVGICHRDIKPMNVLLDENNNAKFADFGASDFYRENEVERHFCDSVGTYNFFSPEMCDESVKEYSGPAADVWALGVTLYALAYNKLPY